MSTTELNVVVIRCDTCEEPARAEDQEPIHFESLQTAISCLTGLGIDWEYFPDTDRWLCDACRVLEACTAAGGHVWGSWRDSWLRDGSRWRECIRYWEFGRCPGYEARAIETVHPRGDLL